ncbi:Uncharacterised protein [Vibrio cholerae]|nr:Uncharacterised protein [Vibrio cholerae]
MPCSGGTECPLSGDALSLNGLLNNQRFLSEGCS